MKVYLDNAATTPMDSKVFEAMAPVMQNDFGNPSSTHFYGRKTRSYIEVARRNIAQLLNVSPGEIFFTSGGTEADNMAIRSAVHDLGIQHLITTTIEHHAIGHTFEALEKDGLVKVSYVNLLPNGHVDFTHLEKLLAENERSFVSLMHANNEIGNLLNIEKAGVICDQYNAVFHSDTVQTMGHYKIDLRAIKVHFITCAAHKFHGPKGCGFLYVNNEIKIKPLIYGGAQERNMRGGTENVYGIVGLSKALEIALTDVEKHQKYVQGLKTYMIEKLENEIPGTTFNGDAKGESLYTVLNVLFPETDRGEMLLFNLDIAGIACSGGSACTSGSNQGSHVLKGIKANLQRPSIRFSFSKMNTKEEIDYCVEHLVILFNKKTIPHN